MKWWTCIIHNARHVTPVQWFHTRAETPAEAARNAHRWALDGEGELWAAEDVDVPLVFEGRLEPAGGSEVEGE